jgi:multiple sugar transport system substrate-binding protein
MWLSVCVLMTVFGGCNSKKSDKAEFWNRQTTVTAELMQTIVTQFNETHSGLPIESVYAGNYGEIYRKVIAGIRAKSLPAMAVAYENMTAEYAQSNAVIPLDPWLEHPESGLTKEELDDFFPSMLNTNRFAEFDGALLSLPFTKSVLVLYYNKRVLREAGLDSPPKTWDEFLVQSRQIKEQTGKFALSFDVDCSTINGILFSMGGTILHDGITQYDSPESINTFSLIERLFEEKLAYQNPPGTFNDETALGNDEIAFILRTSSNRPYLENLFEDHDAWGIAPLPQADPDNPKTVLYGGSICIFDTTPEQQEAAWKFARYFTSTETTVQWALGTGYLPVRRSAAQDPKMQAFWKSWPDNRVAFDCLEFAIPEPNISGWQEIRNRVEQAATEIINSMSTSQDAALRLKNDADNIISKRR